jgi:PEP-CTERM motif
MLASPMGGLALSPSNQLFGTNFKGDFYSVNTSTGAATLIGSTGRGSIDGLDFNGSTLLAVNFVSGAPTIFSIDTATGATTTVTTALSSTGFVRAMAVLDANTVLVSGDGTGAGPTLYSINLTTGAVNTVGLLHTMGSVAAMDFLSDGKLYGVDAGGIRYLIDSNTAATTNLGALPITPSRQGLFDMTTLTAAAAQVPEPSTLVLLATGLASLAATNVLRCAPRADPSGSSSPQAGRPWDTPGSPARSRAARRGRPGAPGGAAA